MDTKWKIRASRDTERHAGTTSISRPLLQKMFCVDMRCNLGTDHLRNSDVEANSKYIGGQPDVMASSSFAGLFLVVLMKREVEICKKNDWEFFERELERNIIYQQALDLFDHQLPVS